jgi:hypothetical protein
VTHRKVQLVPVKMVRKNDLCLQVLLQMMAEEILVNKRDIW